MMVDVFTLYSFTILQCCCCWCSCYSPLDRSGKTRYVWKIFSEMTKKMVCFMVATNRASFREYFISHHRHLRFVVTFSCVSIVEHHLHWKISIFPFFRSLFAMLNTLAADGLHSYEKQWRGSMFHVRSERGKETEKKGPTNIGERKDVRNRRKKTHNKSIHNIVCYCFNLKLLFVLLFMAMNSHFCDSESVFFLSSLHFFFNEWADRLPPRFTHVKQKGERKIQYKI